MMYYCHYINQSIWSTTGHLVYQPCVLSTVINLWRMNKSVYGELACSHSCCLRRGPGCDENTHLWLKQTLLSSICSQLHLSGPPCPSISWRQCLLSGREDTAWLCALHADVHRGSEISMQTARCYLLVVFHCRSCWVFFFLSHIKASFTHFNTPQHFHMLPLVHTDDTAVLISTLPGIYLPDYQVFPLIRLYNYQ